MNSHNKVNTKKQKKSLPFLDHLEELRFRILKCLSVIIIFTIITYTYKSEIYEVVIQPILGLGITIQHLKVYDKFMALLKLSLYTSLLLSFPIIVYQLTAFVLPALYTNERKTYFISLSVIIVLFLSGAFLSYKYLTPTTVHFLVNFDKNENDRQLVKSSFDKIKKDVMSLQSEIDKKVTQYYHNNDTTEPGLEDIIKLQKTYNNKIASYLEYITPTNIPKTLSNKSIAKIETNLTISDYIDWLIFFTCIIGLVFELPMIMVLLTIIRVTNDKTFSKVRPYALIIILIIGAVIAPDVVTQIFVSIPIYLLYEVGIIASFIVRKRQEKTAAAA